MKWERWIGCVQWALSFKGGSREVFNKQKHAGGEEMPQLKKQRLRKKVLFIYILVCLFMSFLCLKIGLKTDAKYSQRR